MKIILAVFSLCLLGGCTSLFYQPTGLIYLDTSKAQFKAKDYFFESSDGTRLHAWHFKSNPKKNGKALIVFFHGNAENLTSHFSTLYWVLKEGYDYLIFDYRGYGRSQGEPSQEGTVADGVAAIRFASKTWADQPLIIFGQSLGGAIALRATAEITFEIKIEAIVVESTFHSYQNVAAKILRRHWLTWLLQPLAYVLVSDKYAPENKIQDLAPTPLLIIHGDQDGVVPLSCGERIYELAENPKELWKIHGGHHIDAFWQKDPLPNRKKLLSYLDSVLKK